MSGEDKNPLSRRKIAYLLDSIPAGMDGYLVGDTAKWNAGKRAELNDRIAHGGE